MVVGVVTDDDAGGLEVRDDQRIGVEHVLADVVGDLGGEAPGVVDRADQDDAVRLADPLVVLAETGGHVHHPGAVLVGDVVVDEHPEAVGVMREVVEHRAVADTGEFASGQGRDDHRVLAELVGVLLHRVGAEHHTPTCSAAGA